MENRDREFIDTVWCKVRYMEYLKKEALKVKENNKKQFLMKLKIGALLVLLAIIIIVPLVQEIGINLTSILIIGFITLGEGNLYEYLINISYNKEIKNEN